MPTVVRSRAKINLGLFLGPPRPDGFHALATVYQTLEMHDVVTVTAKKASKTTLHITSNDPRVPTDDRNTAWRMILLALGALGVSAEVEVHIDKRLPVQGGLGAGSGNAVAALVGLEAELKAASQQVSKPAGEQNGQLPMAVSRFLNRSGMELAAKVGSDVPLFLIGGTVLGVDRGQKVYPLNDIEPTWCVVAVPEIGISTPQAFRDWDLVCAAEGLTQEAGTARLEKLSRDYASAFRGEVPEGGFGSGSSGVFSLGEDLAGPQETTHGSALVRTGIMSWIENDFERVLFPQHPSLAEIKRLLLGFGTPEAAIFASLSGSGSALFGLYLTRGDAEAAVSRIENEVRNSRVRSTTTITRTLPRSEYWKQMLKNVD
ncbi:MAG TPA: 4-(cytidine 5'-diphospho)-2-C-methyl-D-erythritol kinase [Terracidiphilus sp.]|jgi:4-diphosphocytidyl-2-C-methyl-D-erythritol kinase